ncbi:hypothetical protein BC941DRAFT_419015 [Chlamydoabsidia padenii]|nr:hypothetical protein BC941DRAFT_419015 [Chlamydoabsidia padenii]
MGQDIPAGAPTIMVSGYPPEGERGLLNFLHRKSKAAWEELNVQHQGGVTYITVDGPATAENLLRKNGFTYMGAILSITPADGSTPTLPMRQNRNQRPNQQQGNRSNALAQFLQERWHPDQGYLNLDDLPPTSHSVTLVISKLLNEASLNYGNAVVTLSFARNKLWSFQPLNKLPSIFPGLKNLSLQENDINKFKGIDSLSSQNLPQLTELVLLGNPIQVETPPDVYISEVTRRFPSLLQLDFQPINQNTCGAFGSASRIGNDGSLPLPIKASFFDQDNSRQAAQDLLSKFFPLFDSNRSALAGLYDSQSTFSINVSPTCYAKATWGQGQRLTTGSDNISSRFAMFPPTIHDLSNAKNFVTDAWQTSGSSTHPVVLFLTVHGSFREASGEVSFDRVFLIAPSTPGSRSQVAGWQYVILSDSMIIRNHSILPTN